MINSGRSGWVISRFSLLLFVNLVAQIATAQQDYFQYHVLINKAEHHWYREDFSEALLYYDSAFLTFAGLEVRVQMRKIIQLNSMSGVSFL